MSTHSSPAEKPAGPPDGSGAVGDGAAVLEWAQRLAAVAQTGLDYTDGVYDRLRYDQIREIAAEMLARLSGREVEQLMPLLMADTGYATPKIDTRAVVQHDGRLLLVRERSDGAWTLPGGFVDVGEGPRSAVERETREESGFTVRAARLLAVFDRRRHPHPPALHHTWKLFFACDLVGGVARPSVETSEVAFFAADALPPLSASRVTPGQIRLALEIGADERRRAHFD